MERNVVVFDCAVTESDRILCIVRVEQDHVVLLDANQVEGFLWASTDDSAVKFTHEKGLYGGKVLFLHLPQAQAARY